MSRRLRRNHSTAFKGRWHWTPIAARRRWQDWPNTSLVRTSGSRSPPDFYAGRAPLTGRAVWRESERDYGLETPLLKPASGEFGASLPAIEHAA